MNNPQKRSARVHRDLINALERSSCAPSPAWLIYANGSQTINFHDIKGIFRRTLQLVKYYCDVCIMLVICKRISNTISPLFCYVLNTELNFLTPPTSLILSVGPYDSR